MPQVNAQRGAPLARATAVLKRDPAAAVDDSLDRLRQSKWWATPALTSAVKPRVFIVNR